MKNIYKLCCSIGIAFSVLLTLYTPKITSSIMQQQYNGLSINEMFYITEYKILATSIQLASVMLFFSIIIIMFFQHKE